MATRPRSSDTPAARRIKRKILVAITLTAFLPMLVVAYLLYSYALPLLDPQIQGRRLGWVVVMLAGTGLLMAAGSVMLWDLATSVVRHSGAVNTASTARRASAAGAPPGPGPRPAPAAGQ